MKVLVRELVKFEETHQHDITCGMGVDMVVAYIPVEDVKTIKEYNDNGFFLWEEDKEIDTNDFTLFRGEYILNEELEEAKMFAEWADNAEDEERMHNEYKMYEGQLDHEARA